MDLYTAIKGRRSCRHFSAVPVEDEILQKLLDAAVWAPSPLNSQPWEFVVVKDPAAKRNIHAEALRCRDWALEVSGWKWLGKYDVDFLLSVPVMVAVVGDPAKTGVDMYMEGGSLGYQHACAAAIQNMLLAAHAEGLGGLWFTLFDKRVMRDILGVEGNKEVVGLVCLGRPAQTPSGGGRKPLTDKVRYLR